MRLYERYVNLWNTPQDKEKKVELLDTVWEMVQRSYDKVGGCQSFDNKKENMLEDRYFWKLCKRGDHIDAFAIYKTTHGRKLSACGSDGTPEGKKDLYKIIDDDLQFSERGVWAEVSGAIEHAYKDRVNVEGHKTGEELGLAIPAEQAVEILDRLNKPAEVITSGEYADGYHYKRVIGAKNGHEGEEHIKMMIGRLPKEMIDESSLNESVNIDEDKTVNVGGTPNPEFGWCIIMVGGPGSGKSTHYKNLVNINAKYYNPDDFKSYLLDTSEFNGNVIRLKNGKEIDLDALGIEPPYNLSNPRFVSLLHSEARPISNKYKDKLMYDASKLASKDRLPNIAFDICGSKIDDIYEIVDNVKEQGYKIAIVWVITDIDMAIDRADHRERKSKHSLLLSKHNDVYNTMATFVNDKKLVSNINEFWVIMDDYTFDLNSPSGKMSYIKNPNCFKIPKDDIVHLPDEIESKITKERQRVIDLMSTNNEE